MQKLGRKKSFPNISQSLDVSKINVKYEYVFLIPSLTSNVQVPGVSACGVLRLTVVGSPRQPPTPATRSQARKL